MINDFDWPYNYGWLPPTPEKRAQNMLYTFAAAEITIPATVEKALPLPDLIAWYDQHATPQCVGYSSSWMTSINTLINPPNATKKYNATWLYTQACRIGNTSNGAYVWAAMKALRDIGHVEVIDGQDQPANLDWGIESYIWARTADEVRAAIDENKPCVFGIPWFRTFTTPTLKYGKYWIGLEGTDWGSIVSGHAICCYLASDELQAVGLVNSWGADYPHPVYLPYTAVNRLLSMEVPMRAECAVPLDRFVEPEPPPPPPAEYPYQARVLKPRLSVYNEPDISFGAVIGHLAQGDMITVIADDPNDGIRDWVQIATGHIISHTKRKVYIERVG